MPKTQEFDVREATANDVFYATQLAHQLVKETGLKKSLGFDWKGCSKFAENLLSSENCCLFVAEVDGEVVGFVAGMVSPTFFNPSGIQAGELGWYVDPDYRNSRVATELHKSYEEWAKGRGATSIQMMHMDTEQSELIGKMYEKWGYHKVETSYLKEVKD